MTKRIWIALVATALGVATLGLAQGPRRHFAGPGGPGGPGGPEGRRGAIGQFEALKTYLGLSDTQVAALRQARTDAFEQAKPNLKEGAQKARDLRTEMEKANPDPNTVGRLMTEMKQMREQGQTTRTQVREKSLAVLTDAQKAKLKALEDAAALESAVREARMSGLLTLPEGADAPGPLMKGRDFRR